MGKIKKTNPPDRQQPTWLFPPDEQNPALNPKPKDPAAINTEKEERAKAVDFLNRRAYNVPDKPGPPPQLLNLIGVFLTEYGFHGTCKLFTVERQGRSKLKGWHDELGKKLPKGVPNLTRIYKEWHKQWEAEKDTTSSDEEDNSGKPTKRGSKKSKANDEDETSSSGDDDESEESSDEESDVSMKEALPPAKTGKASGKSPKASSSSDTPSSPASSSSATSSDSDADDEQEVKASKTPAPKAKAAAVSSMTTSTGEAKAKKNKVASTKAQEPIKKAPQPKQDSLSTTKPLPTSSDSDSDDSSSSDSEAPATEQKQATSKETAPRKQSSDSSATLDGEPLKKAAPTKMSSSASSSDSDSESDSESDSSHDAFEEASNPVPKASVIIPKRKRPASPSTKPNVPSKKAKAQNEPFSRIPNDIKVDEKLASNAYVPYDYAQRAHQDLIVTKGKNFTKEKNKKKRGSYRGGAIDVEGRKGIKFD